MTPLLFIFNRLLIENCVQVFLISSHLGNSKIFEMYQGVWGKGYAFPQGVTAMYRPVHGAISRKPSGLGTLRTKRAKFFLRLCAILLNKFAPKTKPSSTPSSFTF